MAGNRKMTGERLTGTDPSCRCFGTITCAEGAEVTIPRWDSKCKVYATGMPTGRYLRGVVFAGTTKRAMVGEDG